MSLVKTVKKASRAGRPPSGLRGEKVSEYPQVMIRLPQPTKEVLDALSGATGTPIWRLIDTAVDVYVKSLPDSQRQLLTRVRNLRASRDSSKME
jgi:hypothetical protein